MKPKWKKLLSFVLAVLLCLSTLPVTASAVGDAMSLEKVQRLLNREELHPQRTGYAAIDQQLEKILAPYAGKDTYTKIKAMYDWSVNNIDYSWNGYSKDEAPAYDCFTLTYNLEYETGLPEAYPKDMIYRTYHMLTARTGVCYDWGILFAVMARYVGIESYVHTGILHIGSWSGHHGWTELKLDGKNYIFDAQQDWRSKGIYDRIVYDHFGIAPASAGRYDPETAVNAARDSSLLSVTAPRIRMADVTVSASRSGRVKGAGKYPWGGWATLTSVTELPVIGWYDGNGKLLSEKPTYTFQVNGNTQIQALFQGDNFVDLVVNAWYLRDVAAAVEQGLMYGTTACNFDPQGKMTRAMLAAVLARADGADLSTAVSGPFEDVAEGKWYTKAVNWAYENGVVYGVSETRFDPMGVVNREQAAAMIVRYLEKRGVAGMADFMNFTDSNAISGYAWEAVAKAQHLQILAGYSDGTVRPKNTVTRVEATAMLMRMMRCLEAA